MVLLTLFPSTDTILHSPGAAGEGVLSVGGPGHICWDPLLGQSVGMHSQPVMVCSVCTALSGDVGSSNADSGLETAGPSCDASSAKEIPSMEDFPLKQSYDDTIC